MLIMKQCVILCLLGLVYNIQSANCDRNNGDKNFELVKDEKRNNDECQKLGCTDINAQSMIMSTPESWETSRMKKKDESLFNKLFPMFVIPYLVQSAMLPMILMTMKMMLMKTFLVSKVALILAAINAFMSRNKMQSSAVLSEEENAEFVKQQYGYSGHDEYGAWFNQHGRQH